MTSLPDALVVVFFLIGALGGWAVVAMLVLELWQKMWG